MRSITAEHILPFFFTLTAEFAPTDLPLPFSSSSSWLILYPLYHTEYHLRDLLSAIFFLFLFFEQRDKATLVPLRPLRERERENVPPSTSSPLSLLSSPPFPSLPFASLLPPAEASPASLLQQYILLHCPAFPPQTEKVLSASFH